MFPLLPWHRPFRGAVLGIAVALAGAGLGTSLHAQQQEEVPWEEKPYTVVDGKVDFGTYNGYRRYHSHCHVCHGPDGLGSSYAPALVESIPRIGYEGYVEAVVYGIKNVSQSQQSVMPAFGEVADVVNYMDDIYAYLKARADGAIGRGRPERLPKEASN
jgi:methanol metabolism-related c-type cytochrome